MEREKIFSFLEAAIINISAYSGEPLTEQTKLFQAGLNLSSLDGVLLIVQIEEEFKIYWPDEYLAFYDTMSIGEIISIIENLVKEQLP